MEAAFWYNKWNKNEIGFHLSEPNPLLVDYIQVLGLAEGDTVFVPLCGKSHDMHWLAAQGFRVIGAELSPVAVQQFFDEWGCKPEIATVGSLTRYTYDNIIIFQGDVFALPLEELAHVNAIYDRAALIALPPIMREKYAKLLLSIGVISVPQFLISIDYDQTLAKGPPFSVDAQLVQSLYSNSMTCDLLARVPSMLKGKYPTDELVWKISPLKE